MHVYSFLSSKDIIITPIHFFFKSPSPKDYFFYFKGKIVIIPNKKTWLDHFYPQLILQWQIYPIKKTFLTQIAGLISCFLARINLYLHSFNP
jgi:hypothetical protein